MFPGYDFRDAVQKIVITTSSGEQETVVKPISTWSAKAGSKLQVKGNFIGENFDKLNIYHNTGGVPNVTILHPYDSVLMGYSVIMNVDKTIYDSLRSHMLSLSALPENPTTIRMVTQFVYNMNEGNQTDDQLEIRPYSLFTTAEIDSMYAGVTSSNQTLEKPATSSVYTFGNPNMSLPTGYTGLVMANNTAAIQIHSSDTSPAATTYLLTSGNSHQLSLTKPDSSQVPYNVDLVNGIQYLVSNVESNGDNHVTFHALVPTLSSYDDSTKGSLDFWEYFINNSQKKSWKDLSDFIYGLSQASLSHSNVSQDWRNYQQFLQLFLKDNEINDPLNPFLSKNK
jgi:hypothetical protein